LQMEEFYATAQNADILIYNSAIDGALDSLDELLEKSPLLKNFKAVKTGNVWCTTQDMFQETMSLGTVICDFHTVIAENGEPQDLTYLYQLR
ncbi:MAG: ABC transporter substrate-binding protein, partial [Pygmaiobacter sp.]